ncbi:tetratricopeptide repeat protein [Sodalinema gerasimenkoae]|uniref:tetratricopeptide repeat protein n=1 Tax=Sodalinema gerasimenkoae TaxID=2862348 RepID=UPI0013585DF7|nr:tetratricopeptide repeat protein [Sodalinema gerasimenkoae]
MVSFCFRSSSQRRFMCSKFALQLFTVSAQALTLLALSFSLSTLGLGGGVAQAQQRRGLPTNPLELAEVDPLIPEAVWQGEAVLTQTQRRDLATRLDQLNAEALAAFSDGRVSEAFELWNRELRLRRFLGTEAELEALQRVGELAWEQEEFYQLQVMRERLRRIQKRELDEVETPNLQRLMALAQTYETVGARSAALELYEVVLESARSQGDEAKQEEAWQRLGETALQDLNYEAAAAAYEALRGLARQRGDREQEVVYLTELAYIYDRLQDYDQAIEAKQALIAYYQELGNVARVTALKISVGQDLQNSERPNEAIAQYQQAYRLAWEALQFYRAQEALTALGQLYERYDDWEAALEVYQAQIETHEIARNQYGLMMTYGRMGQVQQQQQNYPAALTSFRRGLQLAQQLGNREAYFQSHIETVNRALSGN